MSCPHCDSPLAVTDTAGNPRYCCGSTKTFRSMSCLDREPLATKLRAATDRIKRLEAAGDEMERWCSDYQTAFNWEKAKEAKP